MKAQLEKFFETEGCTLNVVLSSLHNPDLSLIVASYKIKKKCYLFSYLVDVRRMLLFIVEQAFLPTGEVWLMHDADTQCTVAGREEAKGQRKFFLLKFFLSCHRM